jgi:hypothetical protein
MKTITLAFLYLMAISGSVIITQLPPAFSFAVSKRIAMPTAITTDFTSQPPIGDLGQPLGKVTTISGVIHQVSLGAKASKLDLVLSIEAVNNPPLSKPITMPFQIFETAKVAQPILGQNFGMWVTKLVDLPECQQRHLSGYKQLQQQDFILKQFIKFSKMIW